MPRPCNCRLISSYPSAVCYKPAGVPLQKLEVIELTFDGLEAIRLADGEGLGMADAAARMGVSRHTFGRILARAHKSVAQALVNGLALRVEGGYCAVSLKSCQNEVVKMSEEVLVAVPSDAPGGLDAAASAHFGHCAVYTVASICDGAVTKVSVVPNTGHEHGNCAAPVLELAEHGVKALVAGGMGMRPLMAMRQAGMKVYFSAGLPTVGAVIEAFAAGKLPEFGDSNLCRGHCGQH